LDEPTSALDRENTKILMEQLNKIKENHTIVMTSHDHTVKEFADKVYAIQGFEANREGSIT
jgi:ABC-type lipoprotein export system ATPase subunit